MLTTVGTSRVWAMVTMAAVVLLALLWVGYVHLEFRLVRVAPRDVGSRDLFVLRLVGALAIAVAPLLTLLL